jgi:acyl carrier protein
VELTRTAPFNGRRTVMEKTEIYERLTQIFRDVFDDDSIQVTPETTADSIEGWDSFNHVNLLVATEAAFRIKFKATEIEDLKNVGTLADLIGSKM